MKKFTKMFVWIPYIILWAILGMFFMSLKANGGLVDFEVAFGKMFKTVYCMVVLLILASPIILRAVFHDRGILYCYKKSILLTVLVVIATLWLNSYGVSKITFSPQGWSEYREVRRYMYYDLNQKNELDGMTKAEVTALLGEPDLEKEDLFMYETGSKYSVYIYFDGEKVSWHCEN